MRLKHGVLSPGVSPAIWYACGVAEVVYGKNGVTVTSMKDGKHGVKSLHPKGLAVDLRTRGIKPDALNRIVAALHQILDRQGFDVVLEDDHIHVEYDPKGGEAWQEFVS